VETVPWRFSEKSAIAFSAQERVPVLLDGDHAVSDSWAIACYLEAAYPGRPLLFGGPAALSLAHFVNYWADTIVLPGIAKMVLIDVFACLHQDDRTYFRRSREERFGETLEQLCATRDVDVVAFRRTLEPLRKILGDRRYMSGESPAYPDYIMFGCFQWARCVSEFSLLTAKDPIAIWFERLLDAFGGIGRRAVISTTSHLRRHPDGPADEGERVAKL
jgi:glutathione S-transferase